MVAIVGPTCTGKTALSLQLADQLEAEIVACDSRTIYRYMDIGTAKPSAAERLHTRHHLIDVVDPDESYSVAQFKEAGTDVIREIVERGHLPIVCGGTGFYARALLEGLSIPRVPPQPELRASLRKLAEREGNQVLHQQLAELDPESARRININDRFRLVRALEVSIVCGKRFSELAGRTDPPYRTIWIGLTASNRPLLYEAISRRYQGQLQAGMLAEVEQLLKRYGRCQSLMKTANYRELVQYLEGEIDRSQADELSVRHNCQLARRQLTWFRANRLITWFAVDRLSPDELSEQVTTIIAARR